jgi:hypothetical protein
VSEHLSGEIGVAVALEVVILVTCPGQVSVAFGEAAVVRVKAGPWMSWVPVVVSAAARASKTTALLTGESLMVVLTPIRSVHSRQFKLRVL